jgi:hypothetical protein
MLINHTINNGGSAVPYVDNTGRNTQTISLTNANAKVLGLLANGSTVDGSISFNNQIPFDFNHGATIVPGAYDFVGVATHEIGHALGFFSGVDVLDQNADLYRDNRLPDVTLLDLFRYSTESTSQQAIDWTADNRNKYFSIDGGVTSIAAFATGVTFGDGSQASHWQENSFTGTMTPTLGTGVLDEITETDLQAFDAIGYSLAASTPVSVPEPSNFIGTLIFAIFGIKTLLNYRRNLLGFKR